MGESSLGRAWHDTEHFRQTGLAFWGVEVLGAALFSAVGQWLAPNNATRLEAVAYPAIGTVFGLAASYLSIFIGNLLVAPYRQRDESRRKIKELQNEELHVSVRPDMGRKESDWERVEHTMWAELQVTNMSGQTLDAVEVHVTACLLVTEKQEAPGTYTVWEYQKWHQTGVYWSVRNAEPNQLTITVPAGVTRVATIAYQDDSNGGNFNFNSPNREWMATGVRVSLEVSCSQKALWSGGFYLECHPNYYRGDKSHFEFVEWDAWVAEHIVS